MSTPGPSARLVGLPTTSIWQSMTPLAIEHKAVNLGQGFPSFSPPKFLLDELDKVITESNEKPLAHQYCPVNGHPELVNQLREEYGKRFGFEISPKEVTITNGVTQGMNAVMQTYINPGDEVVLIEPFYDAYYQDVYTCGGVPKYVPLAPSAVSANDWVLTEEALRSGVTNKTKIIIVNTPQNIPGKVWSRGELEIIAAVATELGALVIADEVYMHLTYNEPHISIATFPGMWERTITMCSAGKTFSCTGWKIGWAIACEKVMAPLTQMISYQTFCTSTPFQVAVARAMKDAETNGYYEQLREEYAQRIAFVVDMLNNSGLTACPPSGGFFVMADISKIDPKHYYDASNKAYAKDWQFCLWLTKTVGVCAIPTTAFCQESSKPIFENFIRFAACKPDSELTEAAARLKKLVTYCAE